MKASVIRTRKLSRLLCSTLAITLFAGAAPATDMGQYNVVWNSPSKDQTGVMPFGNGDIAAGAWAIENGDLFLLLSKNDAFNYMGDLFKTGRVRVSLEPNPFKTGKPFRQTLDLPTGSIQIEADGVNVRLWADANKPVYHIEIRSPKALSVTARPEFWKRIDGCGHNGIGAHSGLPQDVKLERNGAILWYFPVGDHSVHAEDLKFYGIEADAAKTPEQFPDPYRFNTFGNLLESPSFKLKDGVLSGSGGTFDIRIHSLTMQTPAPEKWIAAIESQAARKSDTAEDWKKHCAWWQAFWDRGWIVATDTAVPAERRGKLNGEPAKDGKRTEADGAALVSQSYNFHRFLMATESRGRIQMKFNGGLFTQPFRVKGAQTVPNSVQQPDGNWFTHEDERLWGRRFTFQNQRLLYWPLLASGDFDLMKPFFAYYNDLLPVRKAITKNWFGHDGAYYRENIEPNGAERDSGGHPPKTKPGEKYKGWYHDYYFTCGLETTAMMLDYVRFTGDTKFRDEVLVPFAREILLFFDKHYQRDANGKLRLDPAQVIETWWVAVNPAPDVAGLRFCLDGLLAMKAGTSEDQAAWRKFRTEIPEIPMQTIDGKQAIAPAEKWERKHNFENGELYPVFPFRCFGLALGTGDIVAWTLKHRTWNDCFGCACWTQDQIDWACAGNATEAAAGLVHRFRIASPMCRFPLYGREGPDSCPDFDHFGSGSVALQRMLLQEGEGKLMLFPAWPKNWDVSFKLHASRGTVVEGVYRGGKVESLNVTPAERAKEVVNYLQNP